MKVKHTSLIRNTRFESIKLKCLCGLLILGTLVACSREYQDPAPHVSGPQTLSNPPTPPRLTVGKLTEIYLQILSKDPAVNEIGIKELMSRSSEIEEIASDHYMHSVQDSVSLTDKERRTRYEMLTLLSLTKGPVAKETLAKILQNPSRDSAGTAIAIATTFEIQDANLIELARNACKGTEMGEAVTKACITAGF